MLLSRQQQQQQQNDVTRTPTDLTQLHAAVTELLMHQNSPAATPLPAAAPTLHQTRQITGNSKNRARIALERSVSAPIGIKAGAQCSGGTSRSGQTKNVLNPSRYKTEMCRTFVENGFCKYGSKCQFAHGSTEQRLLPRHPKYKTEYCKTFHTTGFCTYGARCHFIHNEDESKLREIANLKHRHATEQAAQELIRQFQLQNQILETTVKTLVSQQLQQYKMAAPMPVTSAGKSNMAPAGARWPPVTSRPLLQHSVSVLPLMRLGSTADSPPGSPIMSPNHENPDHLSSGSSSAGSAVSDQLSLSDDLFSAPHPHFMSPPSTPSSSPRKISTGSNPDFSPASCAPTLQSWIDSNPELNTQLNPEALRLPIFNSWKS